MCVFAFVFARAPFSPSLAGSIPLSVSLPRPAASPGAAAAAAKKRKYDKGTAAQASITEDLAAAQSTDQGTKFATLVIKPVKVMLTHRDQGR